MLGDDIVIKDTDVARQYSSIIASLGVKISLEKTLVSKDSFEFAKRFFSKGQELTSYPTKAIDRTSSHVSELWSTLVNAESMG